MAQKKLEPFLKAINVTYCSCNKFVEKNQWKPYKNLKALISSKIREKYPRAKVDFEGFELPDKPKHKIENKVVAEVGGKKHVVTVIIKQAKCNLCEKEGTEYFEAILQVRSANMDVLEKSVELLNQRVDNLRHRGLFINKIKRQSEGYDLFMTNKKMAQSLARELYDVYGGVYKASPHLQTRDKQKSKNVYRVSVFIRLPGFVKGDIIVTDDDKVFKVDKLGKKIKLLNLDKNSFENIEYKKIKYHKLKKHSTYVCKVHPHLEVINPLDFQSSMVKNKHDKKHELGQEVDVVVHKGIYLVE